MRGVVQEKIEMRTHVSFILAMGRDGEMRSD